MLARGRLGREAKQAARSTNPPQVAVCEIAG